MQTFVTISRSVGMAMVKGLEVDDNIFHAKQTLPVSLSFYITI